jgi:enoyl-CoA hydratase/carnithine racemase
MTEIVERIEDPGIAWVTLNRPARRNAVTLPMWRRLGERFGALSRSPDVRAIVLAGAGEHFCAGADIGEFGTTRASPADAHAYEQAVDDCLAAIAASPRPTIAAVAGYCLGGGCGLAVACDFRLAHRTAVLGVPAARLGIVYGIRETRNLLALVGLAHSRRILFTGRRFDAAEAVRMGLVDQVVDGDLPGAVRAFATALCENAPGSIAGAKLVLDALVTGTVEARRADVERALQAAAESQDYREGVRAFLERRRPAFTGR